VFTDTHYGALVLARDSICLARYILSSARLFVCHTGGSVKTVEVRNGLCIFTSPIPLVFVGLLIQNFWRVPPGRGRQTRRGGENEPFYSFKC